MGKFTDDQSIPPLPGGRQPLNVADGNGIQSQAWNGDERFATCLPLVSRVEGDEYGDDA